MKRLILILFTLALIPLMTLAASGKSNEGGPVEIYFGKEGMGDWDYENLSSRYNYRHEWTGGFFAHIAKLFEEETGVKVKFDFLKYGNDTIYNINKRVDSKEPYDIVWCFGNKLSQWAFPRYAVNVREEKSDAWFDQFLPSALSQFNADPDEAIYIVPGTAWGIFGMINTDMFPDRALPDGVTWTIDQYEIAMDHIKRNYPDAVPSHIGASASYDMAGWYSAFGAKFVEGGKIVAGPDQENLVKALKYLYKAYRKGYCAPDPQNQTWETQMDFWKKGTIGFGPATWSWADVMPITCKETTGKTYNTKIVEFPTVKKDYNRSVPMGPDGIMIFKNHAAYGKTMGDLKVKYALKFLDMLALGIGHETHLDTGRFSPLRGATPNSPKPNYLVCAEILGEHGVFNMGYGNKWQSAFNDTFKACLDRIFGGEPVKDSLTKFEKEMSELVVY